MTDLIKGLLSQMSSKFNEQTNPVQLDFQEDKTLKWKTLINNTYAKKDREKRNKNRNKDGEDSTDDKSSIQQQSPSSTSPIATSSSKSESSSNNSNIDVKYIQENTMEKAEESKSTLVNEKFGNNVKEKKIVIDDDLHTPEQKSAAAQATSTHTNTSDDENSISTNLPQLNTNSQAIEINTKVTQTTVTTSTLTDKKYDDNTVIMSSKNIENVTSVGVATLSDDDKKAGSTATIAKTTKINLTSSSNICNKVIDKTTGNTSRNLRSNKNSSVQQNILQNLTTPTQRQTSTSSSMSDDKNKTDETAAKSDLDLDENETTFEESSNNTNDTPQTSVIKKGRGRPRLEANKNISSDLSKAVKSMQSLDGGGGDGNDIELDSNQKRSRSGRIPKTRSIIDSASEEKKCETPTAIVEDVDVKKEIAEVVEEAPKRRGRSSRKVIEEKEQISETVKDEKETDVSQSNDDEGSKSQDQINSPKRKRGRLNITKKSTETELEIDDDKNEIKNINDDATNASENADDIKPRLLMTIRTDKSAVPKIITPTNSLTSPTSATGETDDQDKVVIKKRGRRPKATSMTKSIQVKKSLRLAKDDSDANTSDYSNQRKELKSDPVILAPPIGRMRSQRRIKPTAKILENEELRQGFEVTNCKRLSLSNENLMDSFLERSPQTTSRSGNDSNSNRSPNVASPESKQNDSTSHETENLILNTKVNNVIFPTKKPCRDPQEFLNEIKSFKIGTNRSPEDNKKLTKNQQRRLLKAKEKHLGMLGLRPKNDDYSSSSNESDTEDFNPSTSKRPTITLRLRNQHKSGADYMKRNVNLRKREHTDALHIEKRMKMAAEKNQQLKEIESSDDDDCIVVESGKITHNESTQVSCGKENNHINLVCSCQQKTKYYIKQGQNMSLSVSGKIFCCAIDEIEKRKIGCINELTDSLICLYRPSVKVSYMVLCSSHKKRLASHNCCSGCGLFCTQGTFVICNNKHFFHRNCATKYILNTPYEPNNPNYTGPTLLLKCPHCGIDAPEFDYRVTMRCENLPVFVQHRSNVP